MQSLNSDFRIRVNQFAAGDMDGIGMIDVSETVNIGWNTMVRGFMSERSRRQNVEVPVRRLDSYIRKRNL